MSIILKVKERIIGPSGCHNIQNEWYGYIDEFKYTIGIAGLAGFGVGCCYPELLPADMVPMPGCEDRFSPNYGNYLHLPSASIMCFLPKHFIDIQGDTGTSAPTYGQPIVISGTQTGNTVLARAFRNNGQQLAGLFIDKYLISNGRPDGSGLPNSSTGSPGRQPDTGGISVSRPFHWPVTANSNAILGSPFSKLTSTALNPSQQAPSNTQNGCWSVARSRGTQFHPTPIWVYSQIAYLSLAHAQALLDSNGSPITGATTNAAWMDVKPYAPKGNNNSNCNDFNQPSLRFDRIDIDGNVNGRAGENHRSFNGAAWVDSILTPSVDRTTHNGQLSGLVDLNGNAYECAPGIASSGATASGYAMVSDSADWGSISSNGTSAGGIMNGSVAKISLIQDTGDNGIWWTDANVWSYLTPSVGGTFHPVSSWSGGQATRQAMTECMIPRSSGTNLAQDSINIFGGDGFRLRHFNDVMFRVGGFWGDGPINGIFVINMEGSAATNRHVGCRSIRMLTE